MNEIKAALDFATGKISKEYAAQWMKESGASQRQIDKWLSPEFSTALAQSLADKQRAIYSGEEGRPFP